MKEFRFQMPVAQQPASQKKMPQRGAAGRKKRRKLQTKQRQKIPQQVPQPEPKRKRPSARQLKEMKKKAVRQQKMQKELQQQTQPQRPKRRITAAETRRRRLRKRLFKIFFITLLIVLGVYMSLALVFKIEKIEVQGSCRYSTGEITEAFGYETGESIFAFRISAEEKKLMQKLPYLETVKVRRRMPDTVVFIVEPAEETYAVPAQDGYVVLSKEQKILRTAPACPEGVCEIVGIKAKKSTVGEYFTAEESEQQRILDELLPLFQQSSLEGIIRLDISDPLNLKFLVWQGDIEVLLGTDVKLSHKISTVDKLLSEEIPVGSQGILDTTASPTTGKTIFRQGDKK